MGRPWAALLVMGVSTPVIFAMSFADPEMNSGIGLVLVLGILGLLVKSLDTRIVRRERWSNVLEDAELTAVLAEHHLSRSDVRALPRELLSMEHFEKRPLPGRPEPLTAYSDPHDSFFAVVVGVQAGDSDWDIVSARRGPVQERSFRIEPKLRTSSKPVEKLSDLYRVKIRTGTIPERLERWLVAERPLVEIDVRGGWTTCRLAAGGTLSRFLSRALPEVAPFDLRTLLISVDSASRAARAPQR